MARARNIKPGLFKNEDLADLDPLVRLFFIGSWTIADYKGCFRLRPRRLKVEIMPYDDVDVLETIKGLADAGFYRTYTIGAETYVKIINFEKHQHPHKNEVEAGSDIPDEPPAIAANTIDAEKPELIGTKPEKIGSETGALRPLTDSLLLDTDSSSSADAATEQPKKAVGKPKDERRNHPAIVAILQHTEARPPKTVYDAIISAVGDAVDTDRLKECFTDWCMKGYNPQNFAWVTEWYAKGTKPKTAEEEMPQSNGRLPYDSWVFCAFAKSTPEEKILMYPKVRAEYLFQWPNTEAEINEYEQTAEYRENYAGAGQIGNGSVAATGRGTAQTQSKVPVSH